ncbi:MAG: hypothetical protein N2C14_05270 [Planctomycetales bacterium]
MTFEGTFAEPPPEVKRRRAPSDDFDAPSRESVARLKPLVDCAPLALPVLEWTPRVVRLARLPAGSQPDQQPEHWQSQRHTTTNPFSTCCCESNTNDFDASSRKSRNA